MHSGNENDHRMGDERLVKGFTEWVTHSRGENDHKMGDKKMPARCCGKPGAANVAAVEKTKKKHAAVELPSGMFSRGKECDS